MFIRSIDGISAPIRNKGFVFMYASLVLCAVHFPDRYKNIADLPAFLASSKVMKLLGPLYGGQVHEHNRNIRLYYKE